MMNDVEIVNKPNDTIDTVQQNQANMQQQQQQQPIELHQPQSQRCPPPYLKSANGVVKIVEMVLCLVTFACSLGGRWSSIGGGWVEFVAITAFVLTTVWFMMHLVNAVPRCLLVKPWEFITCTIIAVLYLVSAIVASVRAPYSSGAVSATAFFAFVCVALYGTVDAYFQVYDWRTYTTAAATVKRSISTPDSSQPLHANL